MCIIPRDERHGACVVRKVADLDITRNMNPHDTTNLNHYRSLPGSRQTRYI